MILTTSLLVALLGGTSTTFAAPVSRSQRDAELFTEALGPWFKECQNQSGGQYCVELAYKGVAALGANAAVCAQQDIADTMVEFAKTLSNNTALIAQTRIYAQQPRSSSDGMAVLYCQDAPTTTELSGVYPCQSAEFDLTKFTGSVTVGAAGTIPFGLTEAVNPAGSCPDRDTPVPAGEFLTDQSNKSAAHKTKTNSKATTSTSRTQGQKSGKHMTFLHVYSKRQEEGGGGGGEEGAETPAPEEGAETLPADEGSADPPAEGAAETPANAASNPDGNGENTGSSDAPPADAPPADAPPANTPPDNAAPSPSTSSAPAPSASTPATAPMSSESASPFPPGSPQANALSQALVSMTNALASASNAVAQAACSISETAKTIAKLTTALLPHSNPAPPSAPSPSPPCPSSSGAPSPTDGQQPSAAPSDPNAPAPTPTDSGAAPPPPAPTDPATASTSSAPDSDPRNREAPGSETASSTSSSDPAAPTEGGSENGGENQENQNSNTESQPDAAQQDQSESGGESPPADDGGDGSSGDE